jgi:hypothetical protein
MTVRSTETDHPFSVSRRCRIATVERSIHSRSGDSPRGEVIKMRFYAVVALAAVSFGALASSVPASAQPGPPSQAIVQQLVASNRTGITWHWVKIGSAHQATAYEASMFQTDLGQAIYPVRVSYTITTGSGPAAYIRDYTSTYVAFQNRIMQGRWDLSSNTQKDDIKGVLRSGG